MKIRSVLKKIKIIIYILLLIFSLFAFYVHEKFNNLPFEQILYNIAYSKGANISIVFDGFIFIFIRLIVIALVVLVLKWLFSKFNAKIYFNIGFKNKIKRIQLFKKTKLTSTIFFILFCCISLIYSVKALNIDKFIINLNQISTLYEEYYVDGRGVEITFPEQKKNLIHIYVESMESTNVSYENGGLTNKSYIPNLEMLALENINFSNTDKIGGALRVNLTNWTIAALVGYTSGINFNLPIMGDLYKNYSGSFPGVYNLGDILSDNGYGNYFMIGSDADFGGRKDYFEAHGDYNIYDYYYAIEQGWIDEDYYVWWGYEDAKLFEFSKQQLLEISKSDEPFNFTILTADTHFYDGYMDETCKNVFDKKYANSIYCSDNKIYNFVKWIQEQDFYKDSVIIISGDHLSAQADLYEEKDGYDRTIYNVIINSEEKPLQEKNRQYSIFDMFPTTLAALGAKIEGNKLGLGVNLFSEEKTLTEKMGYNAFNNELNKYSTYYNEVLLGNTYYEMMEKK